MKLLTANVLLVASVSAQTAEWSPCTQQDCQSKGWRCCPIVDKEKKNTGTSICTDPTNDGPVPIEGGNFVGQEYICYSPDIFNKDNNPEASGATYT